MNNFQIEEVVEQTNTYAIYKVLDKAIDKVAYMKQYVVKSSSRIQAVPEWQKDFRALIEQATTTKNLYLRTIVGGDVDYLQGRPYVLYETLPDRSLSSIIEGTTKLGLNNAVQIGVALLEAIIQLEKMDFVHGTISPEYVLYQRKNGQNPWLLDWDPLCALEHKYNVADLRIDEYTAPELMSGLTPTSRSDVYSIGKIMESVLGSDISDSHIKKWISVATTMSKYNRFKHPKEALIYLTNRNVTKQNLSTATVPVSQTDTQLTYIQTQPRTLRPEVKVVDAPVVAKPETLFPVAETQKAVENETSSR